MHNKTFGILLYKKKIKENDLYVKILSKEDSLITGVVYGGNSRKKNIFQIGYFLNLSLYKKNLNYPFVIEAELRKPLISCIFEDKYKLQCILSIISLINLSIIEGQKIQGIYDVTDKFIQNLISNKKWINNYCRWLFDLLKVIGYEIDYLSNSNNKYFDIDLIQFTNNKKNNTFLFPHDFLLNKVKIQHKFMETIFLIFEKIFVNNHLNNFNNKLPYNYINFKSLIITFLKNNYVRNN